MVDCLRIPISFFKQGKEQKMAHTYVVLSDNSYWEIQGGEKLTDYDIQKYFYIKYRGNKDLLRGLKIIRE